MPNDMTIYTIGHSNHSIEKFVELLKLHEIDVVADVRSAPYSRYCPQFNRENLGRFLAQQEIEYEFFGGSLGGRPSGEEFYDSEGHVLYDRVAGASFFLKGLEELSSLGVSKRVAMMCSEEDPSHCHRFMLVSRVLVERAISLQHIRKDGTLQSEGELRLKNQPQLGLFSTEGEPWRSTRSVSQRRPPRNSSDS